MSPRLVLTSLSVALALTFAAASACASDSPGGEQSPRLDAARAHAGDPVKTVRFIRPINGYEILGDFSLLVWETPSKAWIVDVRESPACRGSDLDNSISVGLESAIDTMNIRNAYVTGKDHLRCKITQIREVDVPAMRATERGVAAAP